jgi:2-dehydropantoate 2-reductase
MATVAVLGPGAVGGALAVRLSSAYRVVCVGPRVLPELTLVAGGREVGARVEVVERLEERVDLLLITVKAPALEDAIERIGPSPAAAVPLLNGLEHVDAIRARLGSCVAAGSLSRFEAYRVDAAHVVQTTPSGVVTLASDDLALDRLEHVAAILRHTNLEVRLGESERAVLWEKVARMAPLAALTAATQRPVGELRSDPRLEAGIEEACAVATADGVPTSPAEQWAIIESMAPTLTTSAARDVAAGRPSELDAITGAVVRAGRRLGVPTPTLEELLAACPA